jgi:D-ribose pyranase
MVETGIVNRHIAAELVKLGHGDKLIIADAGLAVPNTTTVIDVSLDVNVPTVLEVLKILLGHFSVEKIIMSKLTRQVSPTREKEILSCFEKDMPYEAVDHPILRDEMTKEAKLVIRTGDFTAYSNIVLVSSGGPRWYCEN